VGELEFNRRALANAVSWIGANPVPFAELTVRRAFAFWFGLRAYPVTFLLRGALSVLGLVGLWLMWRRGMTLQTQLLGAVWIAYPLTFYVVQYMDRYVAPMAPAILLPAGYAIWVALNKDARDTRMNVYPGH